MFLQGGNLGERDGERELGEKKEEERELGERKEEESFVVSGTSENTVGSLHVAIHVLPTIPDNLNCELFYKKNATNPVTYLKIKFFIALSLDFQYSLSENLSVLTVFLDTNSPKHSYLGIAL